MTPHQQRPSGIGTQAPQGHPDPPGMKFLVEMSNSVLVFFRKDIGHRLLNPNAFGRHFLLLFVGGLIVMQWPHRYENAPAGGIALCIFAFLMLARYGYLRKQALRANLDPHNPLHTMSRGHSLGAPSSARFRISEAAHQRYVEPLCVVLTGACLASLDFLIHGWWFIVAGVSLAIVEGVVERQMNEEVFDAQDAYAKARMLQGSVPTLAAKMGTGSQGTANPTSQAASTSPELDRLKRGKDASKKS